MRVNWLGVDLEIASSKEEALSRVEEGLSDRSQLFIVTLNAEMTVIARENEKLLKAISGANLIVPDSISISKAISKVTEREVEKIPGIELAEEILKRYGGRGVYLLGGKPEVVERLPKILAERFGASVAGFHHGYFQEEEEREILRDIRDSRAEILLVGMGSPKQEIWLWKNLPNLPNVRIGIGIGGSFDVWSGEVRRAPKLLRTLNLEWMYRMITQPSRLKRLPRLINFALNYKRYIRNSERPQERGQGEEGKP